MILLSLKKKKKKRKKKGKAQRTKSTMSNTIVRKFVRNEFKYLPNWIDFRISRIVLLKSVKMDILNEKFFIPKSKVKCMLTKSTSLVPK